MGTMLCYRKTSGEGCCGLQRIPVVISNHTSEGMDAHSHFLLIDGTEGKRDGERCLHHPTGEELGHHQDRCSVWLSHSAFYLPRALIHLGAVLDTGGLRTALSFLARTAW